MVKFLSRGNTFFTWLTEPANSITDPESGRRARLLSSLLLAMTLVMSVNIPFRLWADAGYLQRTYFVPLLATVCFVLIYGLSRSKHVQWASILTLLMIFATIVFIVGSQPQPLGITLDYFAWLVLVGSLLLSVRGTFILSVISIVTIAVLGFSIMDWELTLNAYYFTALMFLFIVVATAIRHQDLQSLGQQNRVVSLQSRVSAAAASSLEKGKILEIACKELALAFEMSQATAVTFDHDEGTCTVAAEYLAPDGPSQLGQTYPLSECPAASYVVENHSPLAVAQAQQDPLVASGHDVLIPPRVVSFLMLPLTMRGEVVGAIRLDSFEKKLDEKDVAVALDATAVVGRSLAHAQLFTAERKARQLSDILQEIAQELNLAPDLDTALNSVLAHMEQVIAFDSGSILLLEGQHMRVVAVRGFDDPEQEMGKTFSLELALLNREVMETRQSLILGSVADDPRWLEPVMNGQLSSHLQHVHSWMGVPLLIRDRVIGMLTAEKLEPDFYRPEAAELAMAFAGHAAVAIENARLLDVERAQVRLAQTLQDVGALLTARLSLDDVFERIFDLLARAVQYDSVSIQLMNGRGEMELKVGRGFGNFDQILQSSHLLARKTMKAHWAEQRVLVVPDTRQDDGWQPWPGSEHILSWVGVALMVKGEFIGILNADSATANAYDEKTGQTIAAFANQAAVAIENARLYDQAQKELAERRAIQTEYERLLTVLERRSNWLQTAAEVTTASNSILEPKTLLQQSVNLIQQRFDFYYVGIFMVDDAGEYAVLQAGSGDAGRQMVEADHQLRIGGELMIGWSVANAQARIAFDVGREAVHFENPLLPQTRSEMVLPLISRGRCIGGLSVQSIEEAVFSEDDIVALRSMADHLAIAIDNARLYKEAHTEIEMRKMAEQEVKVLNENLERMVTERTAELMAVNRELEAFAYSVSHDLRAPLRRVTSFSQALQEDYSDQLDEVAQDYIQRIEVSSRKMAHLIEALLNMSRLSRREIRREKVDLSTMAQGVLADLQHLQPDRSVESVVEENALVRGDAQLLRIVLENLLGNAWKFTAETPQAKIEFGALWQREDQSAFFVRDNGVGFDMAYADRLFTAFRRLHSAAEFEGTGIGLATVQRIIQRHGGRVWAESVIGQGATFCFIITAPF